MLVIDCCPRGEDSATRAYYRGYLRAAGKRDDLVKQAVARLEKQGGDRL